MHAVVTVGAILGLLFLLVSALILAHGFRRPRVRCRQCGAVQKNAAFFHNTTCPLVLARMIR